MTGKGTSVRVKEYQILGMLNKEEEVSMIVLESSVVESEKYKMTPNRT